LVHKELIIAIDRSEFYKRHLFFQSKTYIIQVSLQVNFPFLCPWVGLDLKQSNISQVFQYRIELGDTVIWNIQYTAPKLEPRPALAWKILGLPWVDVVDFNALGHGGFHLHKNSGLCGLDGF
jgi:hypothetical protein